MLRAKRAGKFVLFERDQKKCADGKYELAASLPKHLRRGSGRTESIAKAERLVYLKTDGKNYQNTDPFKYILYSAKIGEANPTHSRNQMISNLSTNRQ